MRRSTIGLNLAMVALLAVPPSVLAQGPSAAPEAEASPTVDIAALEAACELISADADALDECLAKVHGTDAPATEPAPSVDVPDEWQLVVQSDPAFAMLIPEGWTETKPDKGTVFKAVGPDDSQVRVLVHTKGKAVRTFKKWIAAKRKAAKELSSLGFKTVYSGVFDDIPGAPVANVEEVIESPFLLSHSDTYLYKVADDLALELNFAWRHAGLNPLWFQIRNSFNPGATTLRTELDPSDYEDTAGLAAPSPTCVAQVDALLSSLQELNSRLNIGLLVGDYREYVGDAKVAYDRMDHSSLSQDCKHLVGDPLRRALNRYITAENQWSNCLRSFKCNSKKNTKKLQQHWGVASSLIEDVTDNLP